MRLGLGDQPVDVIVTDTITELFLLTPQDGLGQVLFAIRRAVERFSDDVLADGHGVGKHVSAG